MHAYAPTAGELAVVQPLLVTGLLFALPLGARLVNRRVSRTQLGWAGAVVIALGVFLALARPSGGASTPELGPAAVAATGSLVLIVAFLVAAGTSGAGRSSAGTQPRLRVITVTRVFGESSRCRLGHGAVNRGVGLRRIGIEQARSGPEPVALLVGCQVEVQVRSAVPEDVDVGLLGTRCVPQDAGRPGRGPTQGSQPRGRGGR